MSDPKELNDSRRPRPAQSDDTGRPRPAHDEATHGHALSDLLDRRRAERPQALALVDGEARITRAQLDALVEGAADWLRRQGVGRGDRVALWLVNRLEWLTIFLALARVGAAAVAVNTRYRASEIEYLLARSRARMLVLDPAEPRLDFRSVLADVPPASLPDLQQVVLVGARAGDIGRVLDRPAIAFDASPRARPADGFADPDALAVLFTTSGTTRNPKLVMHTWRTLGYHAAQVARATGLDDRDACLLGALPLCGVFGMSSTLGAMAAGAPVVLLDVFDEARADRLVREHSVTHMYGSDEMFRRMLDLGDDPRPYPRARLFGFAAFRADAEDVGRECRARGLPLAGLYGSSEVQALFSIQPASLPLDEQLRPGGRPVSPLAEVRIRGEDGALRGPGEVGHIEIRTPGAFVGYLDDPEATRQAFTDDRFFRTGDIGLLRGDGSFVYETRAGDAMRLGGFLVNPFEIEHVLRQLDGVRDVHVVPIDLDGRHRCAAFVIPGDGAAPDPRGLAQQAARRMAGYKVPARFWFVDRFPTAESANGNKVQRARLRQMALERLAAEAGEPAGGAGT